jgi:hypothetical protein
MHLDWIRSNSLDPDPDSENRDLKHWRKVLSTFGFGSCRPVYYKSVRIRICIRGEGDWSDILKKGAQYFNVQSILKGHSHKIFTNGDGTAEHRVIMEEVTSLAMGHQGQKQFIVFQSEFRIRIRTGSEFNGLSIQESRYGSMQAKNGLQKKILEILCLKRSLKTRGFSFLGVQ